MKDKEFKVKYYRTETGCLLVWVYHGSKLLSCETIFTDERIWFESHKKPESVELLPENNVGIQVAEAINEKSSYCEKNTESK